MKRIIFLLLAALWSGSVFAAVDLNTATQSQLEGVNGIGPAKAKAIIDYRQKNGVFKTLEDLDKVPGFGAATLEKLRKEVVVGGTKVSVNTPSRTNQPAPSLKVKK